MKYIETEFSKELTKLLIKYKKTFDADKAGIYVIDSETVRMVLIGESETASEDSRSKMFFINQ